MYVCLIMGGVYVSVYLCESCIFILCDVMSYVVSGVVGGICVCVSWYVLCCFIYCMCFIHFVWC